LSIELKDHFETFRKIFQNLNTQLLAYFFGDAPVLRGAIRTETVEDEKAKQDKELE